MSCLLGCTLCGIFRSYGPYPRGFLAVIQAIRHKVARQTSGAAPDRALSHLRWGIVRQWHFKRLENPKHPQYIDECIQRYLYLQYI